MLNNDLYVSIAHQGIAFLIKGDLSDWV